MKVLTVTSLWPFPGHPYYGIFVKEQVEGLQRFHPEISNRVWFINGAKNRINYLLSIFSINIHLLFNRYDIIHIQFGISGIFLLFNPFLKKVITTLHGGDILPRGKNKLVVRISKQVVRKSKHVFILNKEMEKILEDQSQKLEFLPCGVNTDVFFPDRRSGQTDIFTIAFPASKERPEKNYVFFEKVILILHQKYGIKTETVEIHGMTRVQVRETLNSADVLVMTSLSEGSPQIIKEAMCCNTPVVSSAVGDVAVLLDNVENCKVIPRFDQELFAEEIFRILQKPPRERISNGRDRIFQLGLDEKSVSDRIGEVYSLI